MRNKLINWEKENGFTGRFVARRIGISDSAWSKIKQGKQQPTLENVRRLKAVFGIENVLDLFKEE